jgi:hypothetical protein
MRRTASGQHSLLQLLLRLLLLNARDIQVAGHTCCCCGTRQQLLYNEDPVNAGGQTAVDVYWCKKKQGCCLKLLLLVKKRLMFYNINTVAAGDNCCCCLNRRCCCWEQMLCCWKKMLLNAIECYHAGHNCLGHSWCCCWTQLLFWLDTTAVAVGINDVFAGNRCCVAIKICYWTLLNVIMLDTTALDTVDVAGPRDILAGHSWSCCWTKLILLLDTADVDAVCWCCCCRTVLTLCWTRLLQLLNTICCCCGKLLIYLLDTAVLNIADVASRHSCCCCWTQLLFLLDTAAVVADTAAVVAGHSCCCCWTQLLLLLTQLLLLLDTAALVAGHSCCCYWTQLLLLLDTGDVISGYYCCCWVCMRYTAAIVELIFMALFHAKVMCINTRTWIPLMKASDRIRTRKSAWKNDLCKSTSFFSSIAVPACLFHIKKTEPGYSQK